jgi:hypothetical protein
MSTRDMHVRRAWQTCIQKAEHMPIVKQVSPSPTPAPRVPSPSEAWCFLASQSPAKFDSETRSSQRILPQRASKQKASSKTSHKESGLAAGKLNHGSDLEHNLRSNGLTWTQWITVCLTASRITKRQSEDRKPQDQHNAPFMSAPKRLTAPAFLRDRRTSKGRTSGRL